MSIYQFVFLFIVLFSHLFCAALPQTARELPVLIPVSKYGSHKRSYYFHFEQSSAYCNHF